MKDWRIAGLPRRLGIGGEADSYHGLSFVALSIIVIDQAVRYAEKSSISATVLHVSFGRGGHV